MPQTNCYSCQWFIDISGIMGPFPLAVVLTSSLMFEKLLPPESAHNYIIKIVDLTGLINKIDMVSGFQKQALHFQLCIIPPTFEHLRQLYMGFSRSFKTLSKSSKQVFKNLQYNLRRVWGGQQPLRFQSRVTPNQGIRVQLTKQ